MVALGTSPVTVTPAKSLEINATSSNLTSANLLQDLLIRTKQNKPYNNICVSNMVESLWRCEEAMGLGEALSKTRRVWEWHHPSQLLSGIGS